jgi:orotate phosphoribosyltransferase
MSESLKALEEQVAQALIEIGAVGFSPDDPITFKSGIQSPVYIDNRKLPFWPLQWQSVIEVFRQIIALRGITFHVIAGIETAGIPHSAVLGYVLKTPSVFVRKQSKEHGTRSRIEGGDVDGKQVLLIEDLVTTGSSSLAGVKALRNAGATVKDCLCITGYGFAEAQQAFDAAGVRLTMLTPFSAIVVEASRQGMFDDDELSVIETWMRDPHGWSASTPEPDKS